MDVLRKLADKLIGLSAFFGSVGLILVVLVILADVIGRFFNAPLLGARDVFEMTMVIVVFVALLRASMRDSACFSVVKR